MLRYNNYLKELGIKSSDYPFDMFKKNISEKRYLRLASWNLDWTLTLTIYSHLKAFREYNCGYPLGMSENEYNNILDEMIDGFAYYIKHHDSYDDDWEKADKKLQRSLNLLAKYYRDLWW